MKALKVRIYPNKEQVEFLNRQFGAVRFIYNKALHIISFQYKKHKKRLNANKDLKSLISIAKKSRKYSWLKEYDSLSLQQSCRNLNKSFENFFKKKAKYPRYKRKFGKQSSYHCGNIKVGINFICIPKLKTKIKAKIHREFNKKINSITISKTPTGKYFASLTFKQEKINNIKNLIIKNKNVIGIDMGLNYLLTDSNGKKVSNPRFLKQATRNLKRKQKKLSRKAKASKSRVKARIIVAKAHEKLVNKRHDFQHKLSKSIIDKNQAIIVETLKVKNMLKNRKLSKHIQDASWYSFISKLSYKAQEQSKHLIKINTWYPSSKLCSKCNYKLEKLSLNIRKWTCPNCNTQHDRDINASLNIKFKGIELLKAEGMSVSAI